MFTVEVTDQWRDRRQAALIGALSLVAAGYPTFVAHPITLLAPVPLLVAMLVLDDTRLTSPSWAILTTALLTWTVLLFLAMDGTKRGLVYSAAMYTPFAALSFRTRRSEQLVLAFAVVTSMLLSLRVVVSWVHSGARWAPWKVYEGNDLAPRLTLLLPLVLVTWLAVPSQRRRERVLLLVLFGVGVTSIVLTQQRAAMSVLAVLILIGMARNSWKALPVLAAAGLAAWLAASESILDLLERTRFIHFRPSNASRPEIWKVALDAVRESSWLGVGPGNTTKALQPVGGGHAHNGLLQSALEAGWPGALLFATLVAYLVVLAARLLWRGGTETLWAMSLLAYVGFSVFSAPLQRPDFTLIVVLVLHAAREHAPPRGERCAP